MKKIFYSLIAIVLMLTACGKDKYETADILIFTQQGCSHCENAVKFINERILPKNPELKFVEVDITYDSRNIQILKKFLNKYDFKGNEIGTPIIIFNNQLLMGWNIKNKVKLQKTFEFEKD